MLPVQPNAVMTATHNYHLVALSIFIAVLASYTALDMAGRVTAAQGKWRLLWTLFGATAMGFGIWAMHYVGMLAFSLGMPMHYDVAGVLYSLLAAICAATLALSATRRPRLTPKDVIPGSLAMGRADATLH